MILVKPVSVRMYRPCLSGVRVYVPLALIRRRLKGAVISSGS